MTKKMGAVEVLVKLGEIVAEKPTGYVYEYVTYEDEVGDEKNAYDCVYSTKAGTPSCIVGVFLEKHVPELYEALHEFEWRAYAPTSVPFWRFYSVPKGTLIPISVEDYLTQGAMDVLNRAQSSQDRGDTWEEAYTLAKKELVMS